MDLSSPILFFRRHLEPKLLWIKQALLTLPGPIHQHGTPEISLDCYYERLFPLLNRYPWIDTLGSTLMDRYPWVVSLGSMAFGYLPVDRQA